MKIETINNMSLMFLLDLFLKPRTKLVIEKPNITKDDINAVSANPKYG